MRDIIRNILQEEADVRIKILRKFIVGTHCEDYKRVTVHDAVKEKGHYYLVVTMDRTKECDNIVTGILKKASRYIGLPVKIKWKGVEKLKPYMKKEFMFEIPTLDGKNIGWVVVRAVEIQLFDDDFIEPRIYFKIPYLYGKYTYSAPLIGTLLRNFLMEETGVSVYCFYRNNRIKYVEDESIFANYPKANPS
jgi:hypothetical protein